MREPWTRPFLRDMALLMLFGDGIGTLAYALVADYAKAHIVGNVARTSFHNDLDLYTNLLGALLQLTRTPWLMIRRGAVRRSGAGSAGRDRAGSSDRRIGPTVSW